jgi:hypothetical protein
MAEMDMRLRLGAHVLLCILTAWEISKVFKEVLSHQFYGTWHVVLYIESI